MQPLTPNLIEKARALRAEHFGWRHIAGRLGVSEFAVRCAIEPGYRKYKRAVAMRQQAEVKARAQRLRPAVNHAVNHSVRYVHRHPPANVIAEWDLARELRLMPRSVTAELLGIRCLAARRSIKGENDGAMAQVYSG